jgi:chromosome segregation ATPase
MTDPLKPCPKCGDGSSEYGCDFCIGETRAADPALRDDLKQQRRAWIKRHFEPLCSDANCNPDWLADELEELDPLVQQLVSAQAEYEQAWKKANDLAKQLASAQAEIERLKEDNRRDRLRLNGYLIDCSALNRDMAEALECIEGMETEEFETGGFLCKERPENWIELAYIKVREIAREALERQAALFLLNIAKGADDAGE